MHIRYDQELHTAMEFRALDSKHYHKHDALKQIIIHDCGVHVGLNAQDLNVRQKCAVYSLHCRNEFYLLQIRQNIL